jgi:hypothetical chaperone protein
MSWSCGIDFGTTNSVAALARADGAACSARVVASEPSCVLVTDDGSTQKLFVGDEAIARYRGSAKETRFVKSMKSVLSDPGFTSTKIFGRPYTASHLARPVIAELKARLERELGEPVTRVVMGRPVHFSAKHENDPLAEERLMEAARLAGFKDVTFQLEPIAAGWSYAARIRSESTVIVADIGGGTADFCVIRFRPDSRHEVLSTGGAKIGGDDFDARIMWNRLVETFGYGSRYESWGKMLEVPVHIFVALCRWDRIPFLKESRTRSDLRYILSGSTDKPAITRLMTLIDGDLGFSVYRAIAAAKHALSREPAARVSFMGSGLAIDEEIRRPDFEEMIREDIEGMGRTAEETLAAAGVSAEDIDSCFLTGGCSLVPAVGARFCRILSADRVKTGADAFSSVATGLALYGLSIP